MKIFDFSEGFRGRVFMDAKRVHILPGIVPGTTDGRFLGMYEYATSATHEEPQSEFSLYSGHRLDLTPEAFGVEAICFSSSPRYENGKWKWFFMATEEWLRKTSQQTCEI